MAKRKGGSLDLSQDLGIAVNQYLPYIFEIRKRLLFIIAIFSVFFILGFIYYERLLTPLIKLFALEGVNIVFTSPFQFLTLAVNTGVLIGMLIVFPLCIYQVLAFLKPALEPREYRAIIYLIPLSLLLFILGFAFGTVMMRYVVFLFYQKTMELKIGNFIDVSLLISQILATSTLMGIAFQLPIFMTLLLRFRIIKYELLAGKRQFAWGLAVIFAALLPPTDILSLVLLTVPIILLFELTLLVNKFIIKPIPPLR